MKTHIFFLASKLMIPMMVLYSLTSIGQVTYVDFTPDYYADTSKDTTIPLDIDSNGSVDVDINHFIYYMETIGNTFYAEAKYGHEISGYTEGYYDWPRGYEFGDSIVPEPLWIQDGVLLDNLYLNDGDWIDNPIGYLGVKLRINNQYHYAWLRIQFKNKRMVWIMDAAISDIPGQSIIAGEGIPSGATSVHAIDREDYFDARDIQVSFAKAIDDTIFSAYRIIIAKAEDSTVNDLNLMSSLPIESYTAKQVYPDDQNYVHSLILASYKLDKDGDPFITNRDYKAYVLNISKSGDTMQNILSIGSLPFQLSAASQPVKNLVAYDERNDLNSSDVKVKFSRADHEELINEYRIFIAPYGMNATADELLSLSNAFHTSVSPINSNQYDQFIKPDQMDITGNIIAEHIPYQIYVVSVADSIYSFTSSVKSTDSKIYLKNPNDIRAGQEEGIPFIEYSIPLNFNFYDVGKYEFDLNQDSIADIELLGTYWEGNTFQFWEYNIKPKRANEILLCDHSEHSNWINPMQDDDMISEEMYWTKGEGLLYYYDYDGNNGFTSYGHFDEDHNYYVGFKINDYDQPQYGWIKLYSGYYEIKIYSYAYQDLPAYTNEKLAGSKLITWDEKNQNNSNDIQISFNPAEKEEMINEYRIFVAPYGSDYNVTELSSLPDEYFTIIVPNASTSYSSAIK